jgi:hypothetical protein
MLASLPIIILILLAIGLPPVKMSRKYINIHWWDYALPAVGLPIWILLTVVDIGETASLSNLVIEGFWILVASALTPWARYFLLKLKFRYTTLLFHCMYAVPGITAILLRLNMPTLPE